MVKPNLLTPDLTRLAQTLGPRLIQLGTTIATAESLTGGLLASTLTYTPGSSAVFLAGVTAYANSAKKQILGVTQQTLETQGAVSLVTALAMAQGIRNLTKAEIGLATTGIAGPDGGTRVKPVGLCYVAAVGLGQELVEELHFAGARHEVVEAAALAALDLLSRLLDRPLPA
ncbi:MAG: CinA family protein [Deltaproteobacteria bacterium]|nr:CinA family protein [Deltaproteobacteria bacterium]